MSQPMLSIVMPVYNVAAYLPACLDSLMAQTFPPDEIIAVDDGSTDACPQILADYARQMPNLRIIRQENGGLSVARNTGINHARGKWLAFVDSDDFVAPDMFRTLLETAEQDDLDMVLCNGVYHFEGRKPDQHIYKTPLETILQSGREWMKHRLTNRHMPHMVWLHVYRTDFLKNHRFTFIPGRVHEDVIWTNTVLLAARQVRYVDQPLYFYRIRQSRSGVDLVRRSREYVIPCSINNAFEMNHMVSSVSDDAELARLMRWQVFDSGNAVFHLIEKLPNKHDRLLQLDNLWESGFLRMLWNNTLSLSEKRKVLRQIILKILHLG